MAEGEWDQDLTVRASNVLARAGLTSKELARKALEDGTLIEVQNADRKVVEQVCQWLGVPTPPSKAIQRAIKLLENNGYVVTKRSANSTS